MSHETKFLLLLNVQYMKSLNSRVWATLKNHRQLELWVSTVTKKHIRKVNESKLSRGNPLQFQSKTIDKQDTHTFKKYGDTSIKELWRWSGLCVSTKSWPHMQRLLSKNYTHDYSQQCFRFIKKIKLSAHSFKNIKLCLFLCLNERNMGLGSNARKGQNYMIFKSF